MKGRIGCVILILGLYLLVLSTFVFITEGTGKIFINPAPGYRGPTQYKIYPKYLIYTLPLGYVISIMGLMIISRPKYGARFWIATIILSISLLIIL